jgi:hypothetical protein
MLEIVPMGESPLDLLTLTVTGSDAAKTFVTRADLIDNEAVS